MSSTRTFTSMSATWTRSVLQAVSAGEVDIGIASVPSNTPTLSQAFSTPMYLRGMPPTISLRFEAARALERSGRPDLHQQRHRARDRCRRISNRSAKTPRSACAIPVPSSRLVAQGLGVTLLPNCCCAPTAPGGCDFYPSKTTASSAVSASSPLPAPRLNYAT